MTLPTATSRTKSIIFIQFPPFYLISLDSKRWIVKSNDGLQENFRAKVGMLAETRRRRLLETVTHQGYATLDELVRGLGVSESTVRRDLEVLDLAGSIKRTHGGAIYTGEMRTMPAFDERTGTAAPEKRAIGLAVAALIEDGDTVLLDGGTTTLEIARALVGRRVQVVTNSLPIAQLLASNQQTELILIGGYVYPRTGVALGPLAIASMKTIRVRKAVLGAGGIVAEGIYNSNSLLVDSERQMMSCGQEIMIVADHTKFGRLALARLCGLQEVHQFVVDSGVSEESRSMLERAGALVHVAPVVENRINGALLDPARADSSRIEE
jgi:DeoR family transcriptional regulator, fructose operon transcriptional repressor